MANKPKKKLPREVLLYLNGDRDMALAYLANKRQQDSIGTLVNILRQEIVEYLRYDIPNFQGCIKVKDKPPELFHNFDANEYFKTDFRHIPYYIDKPDFDHIQGCVKNPIYVSRYKYKSKLYDFANQRTHDYYKRFVDGYETIKEDTKFYLSENEDMLFSRDVVLKFKPKKYYLRKQIKKERAQESKNSDEIFYDYYLYERSLSINMNILLDGDPNKPLSFIRYDNDNYVHNNVWFGKSSKRYVYGESAEAPHFHFQSKQDIALCIKKVDEEDGKNVYLSGRSNAISCRRLASYLKGLDMGSSQFHSLSSEVTKDMPFARLKSLGNIVQIDVDKIVSSYVSDKGGKGLAAVKNWLAKAKVDPDYMPGHNKVFHELIKALDFLTFVTSRQRVSTDIKESIALSNLEIIVANKVMDCISLTSEDYLTTSNDQPKYTISYDFDEDKENN